MANDQDTLARVLLSKQTNEAVDILARMNFGFDLQCACDWLSCLDCPDTLGRVNHIDAGIFENASQRTSARLASLSERRICAARPRLFGVPHKENRLLRVTGKERQEKEKSRGSDHYWISHISLPMRPYLEPVI